jgi:putative endonuclease
MSTTLWSQFAKSAIELWQQYRDARIARRLQRPYPDRIQGESVGSYGERLAAIYLERKGYLILERSFRLKIGEIDVIALWRKSVVVFVEVKTWESLIPNSGGPSDAVTLAKQGKITRTALAYLNQNKLLDCAARADVIAIVLNAVPQSPLITHYENAFDAVGKYQLYS